jgi:XRE family aerobic/anaerobic benzoate catabolism transcriptional regulator
MEAVLKRLGAQIRTLREQQGLSVEQLARRSRLSTRLVTDLQAGRANISLLRLLRVAQALGKPAGALLATAEEASRERDEKPTIIALLGVRGAGKSTIGARLAARLRLPFLELDRLIEAEAGLSLEEIFALHGEEYYRRLEVEALRRLLRESAGVVLATGGGIVTNAEGYELLERHTITVWLKASAQDHWNRVVRQGAPRPLTSRPGARAELRRMLAEREPLYRRARYCIDTTRLGVDGSVEAIVRKVGSMSCRAEHSPLKGDGK